MCSTVESRRMDVRSQPRRKRTRSGRWRMWNSARTLKSQKRSVRPVGAVGTDRGKVR